MIYRKSEAIAPKKNYQISCAVRYKFFFLLLLTLALMFDIVIRPPSTNLLDDRSFIEIAQVKSPNK